MKPRILRTAQPPATPTHNSNIRSISNNITSARGIRFDQQIKQKPTPHSERQIFYTKETRKLTPQNYRIKANLPLNRLRINSGHQRIPSGNQGYRRVNTKSKRKETNKGVSGGLKASQQGAGQLQGMRPNHFQGKNKHRRVVSDIDQISRNLRQQKQVNTEYGLGKSKVRVVSIGNKGRHQKSQVTKHKHQRYRY